MRFILSPIANHVVDYSLLQLISDVSKIRELDWCSYVLNGLSRGVKKYSKIGRSVSGCVLVLLIAYLHRFPFKGEIESSDLPLIQHWPNDRLLARVLSENGDFGKLIMKKGVYPVSSDAGLNPFDLIKDHSSKLKNCKDNVDMLLDAATAIGPQSHEDDDLFVKYMIPNGFKKNSDIHKLGQL